MPKEHRNTTRARARRDELFARIGQTCAHCGTPDELGFDLIVPTPDPKSHHEKMSWLQRINFYWRQHTELGNVQPLCTRCNSRKNNRDDDEARARNAAANAGNPY